MCLFTAQRLQGQHGGLRRTMQDIARPTSRCPQGGEGRNGLHAFERGLLERFPDSGEHLHRDAQAKGQSLRGVFQGHCLRVVKAQVAERDSEHAQPPSFGRSASLVLRRQILPQVQALICSEGGLQTADDVERALPRKPPELRPSQGHLREPKRPERCEAGSPWELRNSEVGVLLGVHESPEGALACDLLQGVLKLHEERRRPPSIPQADELHNAQRNKELIRVQ
mmetsp:Transcript_104876/g.303531  ORF Transcript_104876/g.303531 Transcript_104876/m.303531 type:complete len:225 (+) Transcript_104876:273-947(+)